MVGNNFGRLENMQIPKSPEIDINDAIEFYEIRRYFDKGICHKDCSAEKLLLFRKKQIYFTDNVFVILVP